MAFTIATVADILQQRRDRDNHRVPSYRSSLLLVQSLQRGCNHRALAAAARLAFMYGRENEGNPFMLMLSSFSFFFVCC